MSGVCFMTYETVERSHSDQFHFKNECGMGRNGATGAAGAVAESGGDDELTLATDFHALHAFVPSLDHASSTQGKREGLTSINGAVELVPVFQPAAVMNRDCLAGLSGRSCA